MVGPGTLGGFEDGEEAIVTSHAATRRLDPKSSPTEHDPRWSAVVARDRAADGAFFYSVATTGVYCVPSCSAKLPLPKNVRFHVTSEVARRAGFRACQRCRPDASGRKTRPPPERRLCRPS
ncbi:MAG: Ada metal-binding domain-containing protein [Thermoanaerobaculia bacterium]